MAKLSDGTTTIVPVSRAVGPARDSRSMKDRCPSSQLGVAPFAMVSLSTRSARVRGFRAGVALTGGLWPARGRVDTPAGSGQVLFRDVAAEQYLILNQLRRIQGDHF